MANYITLLLVANVNTVAFAANINRVAVFFSTSANLPIFIKWDGSDASIGDSHFFIAGSPLMLQQPFLAVGEISVAAGLAATIKGTEIERSDLTIA